MSKTISKSEYQKKYYPEWYEKNKEKHLAYISKPINCDCGSTISRCGVARHLRSVKHQKWEEDSKNTDNMIKCNCGGTYNKSAKVKHLTGQKHQNYLKIFKMT